MAPCVGECPREKTPCDLSSPGTIEDNELICRALFPTNRHKETKIVKPSAITRSHLWDGQLSVWRISPRSGLQIDGLVSILDPILKRGDVQFDEILASPALTIRALTLDETDTRAVSLLDECTFDEDGNKHPAHAHIAICEEQKKSMSLGDDRFVGIQEGLKLIFEANCIWQRNDNAPTS